MNLGPALLRRARDPEGRSGCAITELLLMDLAISPDGQTQPLGQAIDDGDTDTMQTS